MPVQDIEAALDFAAGACDRVAVVADHWHMGQDELTWGLLSRGGPLVAARHSHEASLQSSDDGMAFGVLAWFDPTPDALAGTSWRTCASAAARRHLTQHRCHRDACAAWVVQTASCSSCEAGTTGATGSTAQLLPLRLLNGGRNCTSRCNRACKRACTRYADTGVVSRSLQPLLLCSDVLCVCTCQAPSLPTVHELQVAGGSQPWVTVCIPTCVVFAAVCGTASVPAPVTHVVCVRCARHNRGRELLHTLQYAAPGRAGTGVCRCVLTFLQAMCAPLCVRVRAWYAYHRTIAKQTLPVDVVVVDDATTGAEELDALHAVQAFIDAHGWRCVV